MNLKLTNPRSRPAHLASFEAPKRVTAKCLKLSGHDGDLIAERDPSQAIYQVQLPAVEAGQVLAFGVEELSSAEAARGISVEEGEGQVEMGLGGTPLMTFRYGTDCPKPVTS